MKGGRNEGGREEGRERGRETTVDNGPPICVGMIHARLLERTCARPSRRRNSSINARIKDSMNHEKRMPERFIIITLSYPAREERLSVTSAVFFFFVWAWAYFALYVILSFHLFNQFPALGNHVGIFRALISPSLLTGVAPSMLPPPPPSSISSFPSRASFILLLLPPFLLLPPTPPSFAFGSR